MNTYKYIYTDLNSLPSLLTLSNPHSPRTRGRSSRAPLRLTCALSKQSSTQSARCPLTSRPPTVPHPEKSMVRSPLSLPLSISLSPPPQTDCWRLASR